MECIEKGKLGILRIYGLLHWKVGETVCAYTVTLNFASLVVQILGRYLPVCVNFLSSS
jgi:hypothetical protein